MDHNFLMEPKKASHSAQARPPPIIMQYFKDLKTEKSMSFFCALA